MNKVKVEEAEIVVHGTADKPYFEICNVNSRRRFASGARRCNSCCNKRSAYACRWTYSVKNSGEKGPGRGSSHRVTIQTAKKSICVFLCGYF